MARVVAALAAGGCDEVLVVLGAAAEEARALVPPSARVVVAKGWADGLGASLAAGLTASPPAVAAMITLVDLPGLPATVCARLLDRPPTPSVLRRAGYAGRPGHPVLLGASHWAPLLATLAGDRGGRAYLDRHGVHQVECGDLFDGADVDRDPQRR